MAEPLKREKGFKSNGERNTFQSTILSPLYTIPYHTIPHTLLFLLWWYSNTLYYVTIQKPYNVKYCKSHSNLMTEGSPLRVPWADQI